MVIKDIFFKTSKILLITMGSLFLCMVVIAFTSLPFSMRYNLGTTVPKLIEKPEYIVMLGGGGIPEGSSMVRLYHTAVQAKLFPMAKVIVALPGDTSKTTSSIRLMKHELIIRGINGSRIQMENNGTNTHNEVLEITKIINDSTAKILVITSPEHLYRSVKCFQKAGFKYISGHAAFEKVLDVGLLIGNDKFETNKAIPELNDNITMRYRFWNYLQYEIIVFREYIAITYYKLKGWI